MEKAAASLSLSETMNYLGDLGKVGPETNHHNGLVTRSTNFYNHATFALIETVVVWSHCQNFYTHRVKHKETEMQKGKLIYL